MKKKQLLIISAILIFFISLIFSQCDDNASVVEFLKLKDTSNSEFFPSNSLSSSSQSSKTSNSTTTNTSTTNPCEDWENQEDSFNVSIDTTYGKWNEIKVNINTINNVDKYSIQISGASSQIIDSISNGEVLTNLNEGVTNWSVKAIPINTTCSFFIKTGDFTIENTCGNVLKVSAGAVSSSVIWGANTVKNWGQGTFARLGYGNSDNIGDDETPDSIGNVNLGTGRTAKDISSGEAHTCAILNDDTVKCWGYGSYGRLGYSNTDNIGDDETPDSIGVVNLGAGRTAKQISCGGTHTCAILDDDTVMCWGNGFQGHLGYGNNNNIGDNETPGSVGAVNLGAGYTAKDISSGIDHTCAVLDNGTVKCWGVGTNGRLGYGNTDNIGDDEILDSVGNVNLGGHTAKQISCGDEHTCAILDNNTVKCWGAGGSW